MMMIYAADAQKGSNREKWSFIMLEAVIWQTEKVKYILLIKFGFYPR